MDTVSVHLEDEWYFCWTLEVIHALVVMEKHYDSTTRAIFQIVTNDVTRLYDESGFLW